MGKDSSPDDVGFKRDGKGNLMVCSGAVGVQTSDCVSLMECSVGAGCLCMLFASTVLRLFNFLFQNYDGRSSLCEVITSADTHLPSVSVEDCSTIKEKGSKKNHYVQMMISCFVQAFTGLLFVRDLY
jgi:hypothetical protein